MTWIVDLDRVIHGWVVLHRLPLLDGLMWALSAIGRGGMIWLAVGMSFVLLHRYPWRGLIQLALAVLLTTLVADHLLKPLVARERPFARTPEIVVIGGRPQSQSFPSGHAANSFAAALVLSRLGPSGQTIWWALAILIAYSRVYLGVHYPLDVVGGAIVGLICAAVTLRLSPWRSPQPTRPAA